MKTLFVNPSLRPDAPHRFIPVGLGYVVTSVKEAGIPFDILDVDIGGYSNEYVERFLRENQYDVVAVGSIVTHYKWIKWLTEAVRRARKDTVMIVGNSVGSSIPDLMLTCTEADVVILGEADETIVDVLNTLAAGKPLGRMVEPRETVPNWNADKFKPMYKGDGVPGIVFQNADGDLVWNGRRKAVRKIDDLPYPDWDLFDVEDYMNRAQAYAPQARFFGHDEARVLPINTARGCVFKCTFCHYVFWHDPYRHRSADSILGEMRRNIDKYGANYFRFWDELSFHKLGPAEKFVDALIEADLGVHWTCAVRSDLFGRADVPYEDRKRVAGKFKEAGCLQLGYSLESGSDEILTAMEKKVKAEYFFEQVRVVREVGLPSNTSVVFGYPQETKDTIRQTVDMLERAGVYPSPGFLLPLPETGMWDHALKHEHITDPEKFLLEMTERQDIVLNMTTMTNDEMMGEVLKGLKRLNESFGRNLPEDRLIRTGGSAKHNKHLHKRDEQPSLNMAHAEGTPESFSSTSDAAVALTNYAQAEGVPEREEK